jgi:hypothetical protein
VGAALFEEGGSLDGPDLRPDYPAHRHHVGSGLSGSSPSRRLSRSKNRQEARVPHHLTNDFTLLPFTIAELYRLRWQVELFFKWIKQHLRIKAFYGTSPNAVKTQIWIAISVYLLVAIARKRLRIERDLYTLLQILSVYPFEKAPLAQVLSAGGYTPIDADIHNQLQLFDL